MKKLLALAVPAILALTLAACGGGGEGAVRDCRNQPCNYDQQLEYMHWCGNKIGDHGHKVPEICRDGEYKSSWDQTDANFDSDAYWEQVEAEEAGESSGAPTAGVASDGFPTTNVDEPWKDPKWLAHCEAEIERQIDAGAVGDATCEPQG